MFPLSVFQIFSGIVKEHKSHGTLELSFHFLCPEMSVHPFTLFEYKNIEKISKLSWGYCVHGKQGWRGGERARLYASVFPIGIVGPWRHNFVGRATLPYEIVFHSLVLSTISFISLLVVVVLLLLLFFVCFDFCSFFLFLRFSCCLFVLGPGALPWTYKPTACRNPNIIGGTLFYPL